MRDETAVIDEAAEAVDAGEAKFFEGATPNMTVTVDSADALEALSDATTAGSEALAELGKALGDGAPPAASLAAPSQRAREMLCKPWAIVPEALVEITASLIAAPAQPISAAASARPAPRTAMPSGGEIAVVPLQGAITPRGSLLSMLFGYGGGGLEGFRACFREALADDNVEAIVLNIDSPGGLIDLVPETADEIRAARGTKPIIAVANTMAASAAYWIAAQADELVITPSGQVGSIGVFTIHEDFSKMEQMMGISTTIISAGQYKTDGSPYEPLSRSARQALQMQVDELYGMFTDAVAAGRGVTSAAVKAGYGEGRLVLAARAAQIGMVDRVESLEQTLARLGASPEDSQEQSEQEPDDGSEPVPGARAEAEVETPAEGTKEPEDERADSPVVVADAYGLTGVKRPAWQL